MIARRVARPTAPMFVVVRFIVLLSLLLSNAAPLAAATSDLPSSPPQPAAPQSPAPAAANVVATKTDALLVDRDGDGRADPGDTLRYTVAVSNTGTTDAAGLVISDTLDPNTRLVAGSARVSPLAFPDSYSTLVNTPLTIAAPGLLANDTGTPAPSATPFSGATAAGGTVTVSANGGFTYSPPNGYSGTDSFTYAATNSVATDSAVVTIAVESAPTVVSTTPANNATAVPANSNITITFSEPVNVTASAFTIECPSGTPVPFTNTTGSGPATSFTLDPTSDLPLTVLCTVTVVASQVTDADTIDPPDTMAADYAFSFTTTDAAPTVLSTLPTSGTINVAPQSTIVITFSESVNVTANAFTIECPTGTPIAATSSAGPAAIYTLTPATDLPAGAVCRVTVVASEVTDVDSIDPPDTMAADYVFFFTVEGPPAVSSTTPANSATGVAVDSNITVTFDEPVNVTANAFTIECPTGTPISYAASGTGPATTFTLNPNSDLPQGVTCTVTVVATEVTDADTIDPPDQMTANYVFSFSTDAAPTVTSTTPANGATNAVADTTITVNFSEPVNVTASAFTVECPTGTPVAFTNTTGTGPASSFVLNPTANLPSGVTCTVTVVAAQVSDADANDPPDTMAADYVFSFTTDAAPAVTSTTPANSATNLASNTSITVNFSEPVNVTGSAFTVECPTGTPVAFSNTTGTGPASSFVLNPTSDLPSGVTCTVTVVAAQVSDADANDPPDTMAADYVFSFTTDAAPSVTATTPVSGTSDVAVGANITIDFSEPVNVTASAFALECPTGTPIAFTNTTGSGPATSFTLTPSSNLPIGTVCTITVAAAQVSDADANDPPDTMAADYVFSFTTADTAPTVTSSTPANGATTVATDGNITVNFSEPVNVSAGAFTIECPSGTPVAFTNTTGTGPASSFVLNPTANLPEGVTCTVTVTGAEVTDSDTVDPPDTMAADYVFSFSTDAAPQVTSTSPITGAANVPLNATITVNFSESVNATTSSFTLDCGGPALSYSLSASPASSFTLTPVANLPVNTLCTVTVVAAQVSDVDAGDPPDTMAANYVFSFTTVDDQAPTVTSTTPVSGTAGVATNGDITIDFSEPVNVTASAFTVECPAGTPVAFTNTTGSGPASSFVLNPTSDLPSGVTCTVTVVATEVTDADTIDPPDTMAADYVFSFSTDAAPAVTSTTPANGATNAAADTTITVDFSEPVNVTGSAFTVECPTGTPVAFTNTTGTGPASSFVLNPTANLPSGVTCTVTVVAAQVSDADANDPPDTMAANYVFSFSTDAAPTVTSTTPATGATNAAADTTITVNFSEPVNVTASAFTLECPAGTPITFSNTTGTGPASSFVLNPTANLPSGVTCTVTVVAAQVSDADANDPPDTMAANYVFSFSTDAAPTVTSTTPANGATNAVADTNITVNFSEPVNVTGSAFTVECPTGTPVTFSNTTGTGPASSFVLNPTANLPSGVTCTVTVVAAQVSDADANDPPDTMAADYVFSFTTDAAPTVTSTTPANGATNAAADTNITVNFSEPVNVSASAFTLECPTGTPITFSNTTGTGPASSFVLNPIGNLPSGVTCTVTVVAAQVSDADANDPPDTMAANYVFSFSVDAAPAVTSTTPANGATNAAADTNITVNFSELVNVTGSAFTLECPTGTPIAFSNTTGSGPASSFVLNPTANLPSGVTCTVTVVAAQVSDADANDPPDTMAANYVFSFSTDAAPSVTATTPTNGATQQATNANVVVTFSEPVNVSGNWFQIVCATSGTRNVADTAVTGGPTTFTINPNADFAAGESCTVTIFAAQVTDADANDPPDTMVANYVFSFTADAAPTVTSTTPTNGATGVATSATVQVNFSESVSATTSSFTIECPTGSSRAFTLSASPATSFTLTPSAALPSGAICTVTVVAAQIHDQDSGDPPDTMAADYVFSFAVPPVATNDTYPQTVIGNVSVDSGQIPYSAVTNDSFASPVTITAYDATSAQGGQVVMVTSGANLGQFTYNPPAGYTGSDSFTYTIGNAAGSATATVSLSISGMVWFIDNTASAGDGRLSSPFNTLAAFNAVNNGTGNNPAAADNIFVYESGTAYSGPVTLLNSQKLIGQDAASSLSTLTGLTPPSGSASFPTMNNANPTTVTITSAGTAITLAQNNALYGLTVGNSTTDISGTNFGTLTVADVTLSGTGQALNLSTGTLSATFPSVTSTSGTNNISLTGVAGSLTINGGALSGATGDAFVVSGGAGSISYAGTIANTSARPVNIASKTGGTVAFSGAINGSSNGILLNNNTGAAIGFSGDLTLSTGANDAFTATGGGTVTATGTGSTLATTTGTALNIANTTIGASGVKFRSISAGTAASGPASGIVLNTTGSSGGLTVTGTGAANSGGTIRKTTSHGISLNNTANLSLNNMYITLTAGSGIKGTLVNNFSFTNGFIEYSGFTSTSTPVDPTVTANIDTSNIAFDNGSSGTPLTTEQNVTGNVTITGNTLNNALFHGVDLYNYAGTISNLNVSSNSFTSGTTTGTGGTSFGSAIRIIAFGGAANAANVTKATFDSNTILGFPGNAGIQLQGGNSTSGGPGGSFGTAGSGTNIVDVTNNQIQGFSAANKLNTQAILFTIAGANAGSRSQGNVNIANNGTVANPITNVSGTCISPNALGNATVTATVTNNVMVCNNIFASQGIGGGTGGVTGNTDTPILTVTVTNNTISQTDGNGILLVARGATGTLNAKVQNNNVGAPLGGVRQGIRVDAGNSSSVNDKVCLNISGNTSAPTVGQPTALGIGLRKQGTASGTNVFGVNGMAATSTPGVEAYVDGLNPSGGGTLLLSATSGFSNCSLPLLAAGGEGPGAPGAQITQAQLDVVAAAAIARWQAAGLPAAQLAQLRAASIRVADIEAGHLGDTFGTQIELDRDAAGWGWFVDPTPGGDDEFSRPVAATERRAAPGSPASKRMDLLTAVMHELGHVVGRDDVPTAGAPHALMADQLPLGTRRAPQPVAAPSPSAVAPASVTTTPTSVQANVGTLPTGKRVVLVFDVVISSPLPSGVSQVSNQARVTANSLAPVLTDDPATGARGDPTITAIDVAKKIYLPVIARPGTPDLAVTGLALNPSKTDFKAGEPVQISVVVENRGDAPARPFWVDLYLNPANEPTFNVTWNQDCKLNPCFGMAWFVTDGLAPGASITLSSTDLPPGYSVWPGWFAAGTTDIYVLADSWNPGGAMADAARANNLYHLSGLRVTGPNPAIASPQSLPQRPARPEGTARER